MTNRAFDIALPEVDHELSLRLDGAPYVLGFDFNHAEVSRRDAVGLGALTRTDALYALAALPEWGPASLLGVRPEHRAALGRLEAGAVYVDDKNDEVMRLAHMPLQLRYIVAIRASTRRALDALGSLWWAPIQVAVGADDAPSDQVRRARRSGTGVFDRNAIQTAPVEQEIGLPTPLLWRQVELVYSEWVNNRVVPTVGAAGRP